MVALLGLLLVASGFAFPPAPSAAAPQPQTASIEVRITEFAFTPQTVTITSGQSVSWINVGSVIHNVTPERTDYDGGWNPVTIQPSFVVERPFNTPGTYNYYDNLYRDRGMNGTVIVQPSNQQATATPVVPTVTPQVPTVTPVPGAPTATPVAGQATATPTGGGPVSFTIVSPTEGQVITTPNVDVRIQVSNATLRQPGGPNRPGEGHFSLFLDNLPEVIIADTSYTFQNVAPGNHTLRVEFRNNDNTPLTPPIQATSNFVRSGAVTPPPMVTAIATIISPPGQPTPTIGLPRTGDGSYTPGGGGGGWLLIAGPILAFIAVLIYRGRRRTT